MDNWFKSQLMLPAEIEKKMNQKMRNNPFSHMAGIIL
jgi:hypothetical protein